MYILVTVAGGGFATEKFNTYKEAHNQMMLELKRATDYSEDEWFKAITPYFLKGELNEENIGLDERKAYFKGAYDYYWKIFNLEGEN